MPRSDLAGPGVHDTLVSFAARTTSGSTAATAGWGSAKVLRVQLNVTAVAGTSPMLDVVIEDTVDAGVTFNTVGTFVQKTAVGREAINIATPFTDTLRVRWTLGGVSPSFTFAVDCYSE
jgi:hypothetical protein